MPDLWMDVDTALSEVPVNILPLIDDTDFKSREASVTFDQAGMDLVWNFVTTGGAFTQTAVTPTSGGNYDWTNQGDGMYTIEIPASGGASINNDTEGFGWFTGFATGILPWRGPTIGFRAAALNNSLIDGTTIDVNVTAMAASVVTAAAVATGAIDADALAADAATELRGALATGTSDAGGSTTTMVDAARTEGDDVWTGAWILFTSGTVANQCRLITDFASGTDTVTFAPAVTASVGAGITYEILPNGAVDLQSWLGIVSALQLPLPLDTGRVDVSVGTMQTNTVTAAAIASGAIDADSFAGNAIDAFVIADGAIDNATFAADVGSTAIATNVIGIAAKKAVVDALNVDTYAEPGQEAPPATTTLIKKIGYLYKFLRNKITQTSTTLSVFADDAATVDQKATVSDDATTYTRGEIGTGP